MKYSQRNFVRIAAISALLVSVEAEPARAQPVAYYAPDFDIRLAIDMSPFKAAATKLYDLTLGDTIRLGEFGCGDPRFTVNINERPKFSTIGQLLPSGLSSARFRLFFGVNAKIHEQCWGLDKPSVGGTADLGALLGSVSTTDKVTLSGAFSLGPLADIFGWSIPIKQELRLPGTLLSSIPVELRDSPQTQLDFGKLLNGAWTSQGHKKSIETTVTLGAVGTDAANSDNKYLVVDAQIGSHRVKPFTSAGAAKAAFESNVPVWNNGNFGLVARYSLFGEASEGRSTGFLGALLPMRLVGQRDVKFWFFKRRYQFEVVLDRGRVAVVTHGGGPGVLAELGTTTSFVRRVRTKNGQTVLGKPHRVKNVKAGLIVDRLTASDQQMQFRIADFRVAVKFWRWFIPFRLSSGDLQANLNNGAVPLGSLETVVPMLFPDCVFLGDIKLKAAAGQCGHPDQLIGALSLETPYRGILWSLDPTSVEVRTSADGLELTGTGTTRDAPAVPGSLNQFGNVQRLPLLHVRYVRDDAKGGGQCGTIGGDLYIPLGDWLDNLRYDTDDTPGGCQLSFGIIDPTNRLSGLRVKVGFHPDGDAGQCGNAGTQVIPITTGFISTDAGVKRTTPIRIDTDNRSGGCQLRFELEGRDDVVLDTAFWPDGDAGQCGGSTGPGNPVEVSTSKSAQFRLDMDNRAGGCRQKFRLRAR